MAVRFSQSLSEDCAGRRVLRDVNDVDTSAVVLGHRLALPGGRADKAASGPAAVGAGLASNVCRNRGEHRLDVHGVRPPLAGCALGKWKNGRAGERGERKMRRATTYGKHSP